MPGSTKYHMTPAGLMRCRHGQGGVSGKSRACPYGGPVTSSSERMAMPPSERPPVLMSERKPKKVVSKEEEFPSFEPLPKEQAISYLRKLSERGIREEYFEEWLRRDNRKQVAALEKAAQVVDDDHELAVAYLRAGGVLESGYGHYSEVTNDYYRFHSVVGGRLASGGEYSAQVSADSIRRSLAYHKRTDRTALYAALDIDDPSTVNDGDEIFLAVLAQNELEAIRDEKKAAAEAKEAARKAAPIDWHKVTAKQIREDMGKTYDETNPHHVEFAQALEEIGSHRDKFWHPDPRYVWRDSTKNRLIDRVKKAKQAQAAKSATPVDFKKTSVQKIIEALGPKFDETLPLHQELKAKVELLVEKPTTGYRVAEEYRAAHGEFAASSHVWWVKDKTPVELPEEQATALYQAAVESRLDSLFTPWKGDRQKYLKGFKQQLQERGL